MITRGALIFGEFLLMIGTAALVGFLPLSVGQAGVVLVVGLVGVVTGLYGAAVLLR